MEIGAFKLYFIDIFMIELRQYKVTFENICMHLSKSGFKMFGIRLMETPGFFYYSIIR